MNSIYSKIKRFHRNQFNIKSVFTNADFQVNRNKIKNKNDFQNLTKKTLKTIKFGHYTLQKNQPTVNLEASRVEHQGDVMKRVQSE